MTAWYTPTTTDAATAANGAWRLTTQTATLSSNQTTTNQTASDVTGLAFAIAANEVWSFVCRIKVGSSSVAGNQYAVNVPSGATLAVKVFGDTVAAGTVLSELLSAAATLTSTAFDVAALTTAAVGAFVELSGVVTNGATPGTVQIQHAKVTSGTATAYAGATLVATRIS